MIKDPNEVFFKSKIKNTRKLFCGSLLNTNNFEISGRWNGTHSTGTIACVFFQEVTPG